MARTDASSLIVVSDAGPIIHLQEIGCVDLLSDFPEVMVPESVWNEIVRHQPNALQAPSVVFSRIEPGVNSSAQLESLIQGLSLHLGEQDALRIAESKPNCLFLTDDTAARLAAQALGIKVHGTLGILLRAIRREQRTAVAVIELLSSLPSRSTLHIRPSLIDDVIREIQADQ